MSRSIARGSLLVSILFGAACGGEANTSLGGSDGGGTGGSNAGSGGQRLDAAPGGGSGGSSQTDAGGPGGATASDAGSGGTPATGGVGGGMPDVTSEGDGDRVIGPGYAPDKLTAVNMANPQSRIFNFTTTGAPGGIYKGVNRGVTVSIPMQYDPAHPAALMVTQDAQGAYLAAVIDNLLVTKEVPVIVVVRIANGGGDAVGSERGLEYDTVSGLYAEFVWKEIVPEVIMQAKAKLNIDLKITDDPNGHATMGGSSGAAAAFSMVWWHPDLFRRMIGWSPTLVNQVPVNSPFPHGCWIYHDIDPYDMAAPNGLIVASCEQAAGFTGNSAPGPCDTPLSQAKCEAVQGCVWNTKRNRPIRIWHQSSTGDLGAGGGPGTYRNFDLANQRTAAALKLRGYHYHYDHALGAGHNDGKVQTQTIVEAMRWLWRGYTLPQ